MRCEDLHRAQSFSQNNQGCIVSKEKIPVADRNSLRGLAPDFSGVRPFLSEIRSSSVTSCSASARELKQARYKCSVFKASKFPHCFRAVFTSKTFGCTMLQTRLLPVTARKFRSSSTVLRSCTTSLLRFTSYYIGILPCHC